MVLFLMLFLWVPVLTAETPGMMLARVYGGHEDIRQFWVSEKLDGIRARWDGRQLISRGGNSFAAPLWFVQNFPEVPMDGELWIGRGQYEAVVSVVTRKMSHDGWKAVKFMVFDLPAHGGTFTERVKAMEGLALTPYCKPIAQFRVPSNKALMEKLESLVSQGGEGLMLHRQTAVYQDGPSDDLFKLKLFDDAEAVVIGYKPGKGKNVGLMGAVKVRMADGKEFYIGSGFTQEQRKNPPPVGSLVTYRYQGFTTTGIPRFAVFVRLWKD